MKEKGESLARGKERKRKKGKIISPGSNVDPDDAEFRVVGCMPRLHEGTQEINFLLCKLAATRN